MTVTWSPIWRADAATSQPIQPPAALQALAQRRGVGQRAQLADAVQAGAGQRQAARPRAGRQQQPVVGHALAAGEDDRGAVGVERLDRGAGAQLDRVLVVEALVVDVDRLVVGLATEDVLGQRRALVGPLALGAEQDDAALEALLAQRLGGLGAGQPGERCGDRGRGGGRGGVGA